MSQGTMYLNRRTEDCPGDLINLHLIPLRLCGALQMR